MKGDSEYLLKLAAMQEYERALACKKEYDDLRDTFKGLVQELLRYARENHIDLPEGMRFNRITEKATTRVKEHLVFNKRFKLSSPDEHLQGDEPDGDLTAPYIENIKRNAGLSRQA